MICSLQCCGISNCDVLKTHYLLVRGFFYPKWNVCYGIQEWRIFSFSIFFLEHCCYQAGYLEISRFPKSMVFYKKLFTMRRRDWLTVVARWLWFYKGVIIAIFPYEEKSFQPSKMPVGHCKKFYGRYGDLIKHYEASVSQMYHDILGHDHIQWHPQLIRHYTNSWTYYRTYLITDFDLIPNFGRFP